MGELRIKSGGAKASTRATASFFNWVQTQKYLNYPKILLFHLFHSTYTMIMYNEVNAGYKPRNKVSYNKSHFSVKGWKTILTIFPSKWKHLTSHCIYQTLLTGSWVVLDLDQSLKTLLTQVLKILDSNVEGRESQFLYETLPCLIVL